MSYFDGMNHEILSLSQSLTHHPVYQKLDSLENIKIFMQAHVFAVWDFMSLLKSLQSKLTCVDLPWIPSVYGAEVVRLINEIVLGEESDLDQNGTPISHFELYLKAMDEMGADCTLLNEFLTTQDFSLLPSYLARFVRFNLDVAINQPLVAVASCFFYGREKIIPSMFDGMLATLKKLDLNTFTLNYYLKRHIEVDGDEHGPMAQKCLEKIIKNEQERELSLHYAALALNERKLLWDGILNQIEQTEKTKEIGASYS